MDIEDFGGDYDAFENYLDTLPASRRYPLEVDVSHRRMKAIARKLARLRKKTLKKGEPFKCVYTLQGSRVLEAVDGWYSGDAAYTAEDEAHLRKFFVRYFESKALGVRTITAGWVATHIGYGGHEIYRIEIEVV